MKQFNFLKIVLFLFLISFKSISWATVIITEVKIQHGTCLSDGKITIIATGTGTLTYGLLNYLGSGADEIQSGNNVFDNLEPGTYTVGVWDDDHFVGVLPPVVWDEGVVVSTTYKQMVPLAATGGVNNANLCSATRGFLTIPHNYGKAPFTISYKNNSTPFNEDSYITYEQSHTFENLPAGSYSYRVEDSCENSYMSNSNVIISNPASTAPNLNGVTITDVERREVSSHYIRGEVGLCEILNFYMHYGYVRFHTDGANGVNSLYDMNASADLRAALEFKIEYPAGSGEGSDWVKFGANTGFSIKIENFTVANQISPKGNKYRLQMKHPCTGEIISSHEYTLPPIGSFYLIPLDRARVDYCTPDPSITVQLHTQVDTIIDTYDCHNPYDMELYEYGNPVALKTKSTTEAFASFGISDGVVAGHFYYVIVRSQKSDWFQQTDTIMAIYPEPLDHFMEITTHIQNVPTGWALGSNYNQCDFNTTRIGATLKATANVIAGQTLKYSIRNFDGTPMPDFDTIKYYYLSQATYAIPLWDSIPWGHYIVGVDYLCNGTLAHFDKDVNLVRLTDAFHGEIDYNSGNQCGYYNIMVKGVFTLGGAVSIPTTGAYLQYSAKIVASSNASYIGIELKDRNNNTQFTLASNVPAGSYTIIIYPHSAVMGSDGYPVHRSCITEITLELPEYEIPVIDASRSGGFACDGISGDLIIEMAQGTHTPFKYEYKQHDGNTTTGLLPNPSGINNNVFLNLSTGLYTVRVTDACGYSLVKNLRVFKADDQIAEIVDPVASNTICEGHDALLLVGSIGPVISYRWSYAADTVGNSNPNTWNPIGNTSSYLISNAQQSDAGFYHVQIDNGHCIINSQIHIMYVLSPSDAPIVTGSKVICLGGSALLTANINHIEPELINPHYEWYKDGALINGESSSTYTATAVGSYTAAVISDGKCPSAPSDGHNIGILEDIPNPADVSTNPVCFYENPVIHIASSIAGLIYNVYDSDSPGGNLAGSGVGTGEDISITLTDYLPPIGVSTLYYIEASLGTECVSIPRVPVTVTIHPKPANPVIKKK